MKSLLMSCVLALAITLACQPDSVAAANPASPPNIIVIYADDLGYGDVSRYNPQRGKISTPNIDRLAAEGMRFTDAHSSSGVCSPSRYTLLTGRYHWRTRLQSGIVGVFGRPLIAPDRLTVAGMLKQHGYRTACIGKWHLGWDWPADTEQRSFLRHRAHNVTATDKQRAVWREVFSRPIDGGPTARGFDTYFGTDVPNYPPYCFIENDHTLGIPSVFLPPRLLVRNQASIQGPALENWTLEPILPELGNRACEFIAKSAKGPAPFFLYLPLTAPHTPLAVNDRWKGKSGLNAYADFVMETDHVVGHVLDALKKSGVADNTLVLFTSDNGCAAYIGVTELQNNGHYPSGPLRGYKTSAFEGGHRVPFIVRWPGVVPRDQVCEQLVQQADMMATCAEILGAKLPDNAGEDSFSLLPLFKGNNQPVRETAVNQSVKGLMAVRRGPWKLIFAPRCPRLVDRRYKASPEGPWEVVYAPDPSAESKGYGKYPAQLYHLGRDLAETNNLYAKKPEIVAELTGLMDKLVQDGRSTPGSAQQNDVPVKWKRFLR